MTSSEPSWNIESKTVVITGATDGLGKRLATTLLPFKPHLVVHGRDTVKLKRTVEELKDFGAGQVTSYVADYSSLKDVRRLADAISREHVGIDVLVNNAGLGVEPELQNSVDGIEMVLQVNFVAHFLLTYLLRDRLFAPTRARIINVSSSSQAPFDFGEDGAKIPWSGLRSYCQSKLALIMMAIDWSLANPDGRVAMNAVNPGSFMPTKMVVGKYPIRDSLESGVSHLARLIVDPALDGVSGRYFDRAELAIPHAQAYDSKMRDFLRGFANRHCGLSNG